MWRQRHGAQTHPRGFEDGARHRRGQAHDRRFSRARRRFLLALHDDVNGYTQDVRQLESERAGPRQAQAFLDSLFGGVEKALSKKAAESVLGKRAEFKNAGAAIDAIVSAARDGYVTETVAKEREATAAVRKQQELEKKFPQIVRGTGPKVTEGAPTNGKTDAEKLADPIWAATAPIDELMAVKARVRAAGG